MKRSILTCSKTKRLEHKQSNLILLFLHYMDFITFLSVFAVTGCSLFLMAEADVGLAKLGTSFESTWRRRVVETDGLVDTRSFCLCCCCCCC
jgi:hypothetical protein